MSSGLKIAAYYSLPSFSLGFCGPQDKTSRKTLYDFAVGKPVSENSVREIFKKFEAAYSYYKLIATKNNITDPLDKQVVKAFWVGNSLLEKVTGNDLKKMALSEFTKPGLLSQEEVSKKVKNIPLAAKPHHSFHVLFLGSPITSLLTFVFQGQVFTIHQALGSFLLLVGIAIVIGFRKIWKTLIFIPRLIYVFRT